MITVGYTGRFLSAGVLHDVIEVLGEEDVLQKQELSKFLKQ